jgi:hypothetical protein
MINLNDFKSNVYSQYGEDGMLQKLLNYIDTTGFVIEFGAADGTFCSNTANLWMHDGCEALLIESDPKLFAKLAEFTDPMENVESHMALVKNIDDFTTRVADVCSIDIDGADYWVASRMNTPHQIVVIEYNPTVPVHVDMIGDPRTMQGSSALSITEMMERKGYTLVGCTKTNLFFLMGNWREEFVSDLNVLFDPSSLNYVVTSPDGYYDMIGEFGYGFERREKFNLGSRNPLDRRMTYDGWTKERVRQLEANWLSNDDFVVEFMDEYNDHRPV